MGKLFIVVCDLGAKRRHASREPDRDRLYGIHGEPGGGHLHHRG